MVPYIRTYLRDLFDEAASRRLYYIKAEICQQLDAPAMFSSFKVGVLKRLRFRQGASKRFWRFLRYVSLVLVTELKFSLLAVWWVLKAVDGHGVI